MSGPRTVIFDLGGVVLGWDPAGAFVPTVPVEAVPALIERIGFADWNHETDGGRPFAEVEEEMAARFPDDAEAIRGYRRHFERTLTGMVPGTGAVIAELQRAGVRLIAVSNWSAETFDHARDRFGILARFEDIVISGAERVAKPDPRIFTLTLDRFGLQADRTVFVDDVARNVAAAAAVGITARRFVDADTLRSDLTALGVLPPRQALAEPTFHLALAPHWEQALAGTGYPWSSRGQGYEAHGFVHLSFAHQLPLVLDTSYGDLSWSDLVLLELEPDPLIVVEDLGPGPFPHLYAELTPDRVRRVHHALV